MVSKKFYYIIEDLDVTDDKIPDGILVRQFKINKETQLYYYTKNCYITEETLKKIIDDVVIPYSNVNKKLIKSILVSHNTINKIRNKHIPFEDIPRIAISNKSHFASIIKDKNIDINKLLKDLNKIVG
jgi:hypothetical protein